MKLKKLEIHGFKSFQEKAVINFPAGVSSIVGPNGCGKSNIIDALKWVMGEQSASQLRGKSMDDVIFAGTDNTAQLNMAEVSLTLANDNGSAPQELSHLTEIMITRRLYRSGERAYFLNKQPCRLKDIYNIFLGSGMGARSYSIIQQGNIGAITDATPEERRAFIEEAAGVTRYKTRKVETLRKIKSTNQDLLRIKDIMKEVQQRINSLNRQAKKAQRYREYQGEAKALDILLSLYRHNEYSAAINETEGLLSSLEDVNNEHVAQIGKLDAAIQQIRLTKANKERELADQKEKKYMLQRHIDKMENDLEHARHDNERMAAETIQLQAEQERLEEKVLQLKTEIAEAETENVRLHEQTQNYREELSRRREASGEIKERQEELNRQLEHNKTMLMRLAADEAKYHNICENASGNKETLKQRQQEIVRDRIEAAKTATRLKNKREHQEEALQEIARVIRSLETGISETNDKLEQKQKALTDQIKTVHALELERNKIKSRYSEIKRMADNFEWYKDGVRSIMKKASSTEELPKGVLAITADIVQPQAGLETATEAVLGETLQYIVVDNHDSGAELVNYLRSEQSGRSGFIPVNLFNEAARTETVNPHHHTNGGRRLIDHLSVKDGFENILQELIGHVVLADDLSEALRIWHQPNGSRKKTVVTVDGDLITASGVIVGGSQDRLAGILAKKQELQDLKKEIDRLEDQLEKAQNEQTHLEASTRELETDLQKTKNDRNQRLNQKIEQEKELYTTTEDMKHAEKRLEVLELEEQHLAGEESELDDEINRYSAALAEIQAKRAEAEQQIEQVNDSLQEALDEFETFNQTIMDIQLQLTSANAALDNNTKTLGRLQTFQEETHRQLTQLSTDVRTKEEKLTVAKESITRYEQRLAEDYIHFTSMEEALAENEQSYQHINQEMAASDKQFTDLRSRQEQNAEKMRYLEREQADRKMNRENIERRLEERYHQSFAAIKTEYAEALGQTDKTPEQLEEELTALRDKIYTMGTDINLGAIEEHKEQQERLEFLTAQHDDLVEAIDDLHRVMKKINRITQERFLKTFNDINAKMGEVFPRLFEGGTAELVLTEPDKPLETGVELMVHPPGKKLTRLSLLSGGEKALSAIAFVFSIFLLNPTAFCLMDEIDAPLDEANVYRFNELLKIIGEKSQIIMITHNKKTMEFADKLLGVTMEKKGVSKIVSVDFDRHNNPPPENFDDDASGRPVMQAALAN